MEKVGNNFYDGSKKDLKSIKDIKDIKKIKGKIDALDISQNLIIKLSGLDGFVSLKVLNLDHNFLVNLDSLCKLSKLDTLSLNYNRLNDLNNVVKNIVKNCPAILHLSLLKNPINPHLESEEKYKELRTVFKRNMKNLISLDGSDFDGSRVTLPGMIGFKSEKELKPILENSKASAASYDPFKALVSDKGRSKAQTVAGGNNSKLSYNHKAYKKYNSSRSLAERILKSNSEGNRFIKKRRFVVISISI